MPISNQCMFIFSTQGNEKISLSVQKDPIDFYSDFSSNFFWKNRMFYPNFDLCKCSVSFQNKDIFLSSSGLDVFNTQLHDYSVTFHENEKKALGQNVAYLQSFRNERMSTSERQSYEVMEYFLTNNLRRDLSEEFSYHNYLVNQMMGAQSEIISFITKFHRILNLQDAEAYLLRVRSIGEYGIRLRWCVGTTNIQSI